MPWKLRKAPNRDLYWVVNKETGKKYSKLPLPKVNAQAQMKALYASERHGGMLSSNPQDRENIFVSSSGNYTLKQEGPNYNLVIRGVQAYNGPNIEDVIKILFDAGEIRRPKGMSPKVRKELTQVTVDKRPMIKKEFSPIRATGKGKCGGIKMFKKGTDFILAEDDGTVIHTSKVAKEVEDLFNILHAGIRKMTTQPPAGLVKPIARDAPVAGKKRKGEGKRGGVTPKQRAQAYFYRNKLSGSPQAIIDYRPTREDINYLNRITHEPNDVQNRNFDVNLQQIISKYGLQEFREEDYSTHIREAAASLVNKYDYPRTLPGTANIYTTLSGLAKGQRINVKGEMDYGDFLAAVEVAGRLGFLGNLNPGFSDEYLYMMHPSKVTFTTFLRNFIPSALVEHPELEFVPSQEGIDPDPEFGPPGGAVTGGPPGGAVTGGPPGGAVTGGPRSILGPRSLLGRPTGMGKRGGIRMFKQGQEYVLQNDDGKTVAKSKDKSEIESLFNILYSGVRKLASKPISEDPSMLGVRQAINKALPKATLGSEYTGQGRHCKKCGGIKILK